MSDRVSGRYGGFFSLGIEKNLIDVGILCSQNIGIGIVADHQTALRLGA